MTATAVREKPILFSSEMVRAILDGRKTMTRRVISKLPPLQPEYPERTELGICHFTGTYQWQDKHGNCGCRERDGIKEPYYTGDILWVRETWAQDERGGTMPNGEAMVYYRADMPSEKVWAGSWKPSIHMPRWAARIFLEVTAVRVERLQEISQADVIAEGLQEWNGDPIAGMVAGWHQPFAELWDSINGKREGCSWDANPWTWCISFRRINETPTGEPRCE